MTISDEPDEDADSLDDAEVLDSLLSPGHRPQTMPEMPDWPSSGIAHPAMSLDNRTTAWFKAHHADWFEQMQAVLRAWVDAHERGVPPRA